MNRLQRSFFQVFRQESVSFSTQLRRCGRIPSLLVLFLVIGLLPFHQTAIAQVEIIEYTYDQGSNGQGRLSLVTEKKGISVIGWTQFSYDVRGNITQTDRAIEGVTVPFTTRSTYDSLGRIIDMTYPDGEVVRHSYNTQGLLDKLRSTTDAFDYVANFDYNAVGQITAKAFGNGKTTTYSYHPKHFRLIGLSTPDLQSLTYNYDNVGNLLNITDTLKAATQGFGYDNLHRLTSSSSAAAPSYTHNYAYNAIGNMLSGMGKTFTYGSQPPHAPSSDGTSTYAYDGNGNLTTKTMGTTTRTFTWDLGNRLIRVAENGLTLASFAYDFAGQRVKKTAGSNTAIYIGKHYECTNGACSKFIFANGERIVLKPVGSNEIYYYYSDHLGSSSVVTNRAGTNVQELAYYPYGSTRINSSITGSGSIDVHHKFTSQEFDDTTGLYFYQARYYDPAIGRFISPDPVIRPAEPQTLNRYSYVLNNPIRYRDPSGHYEQDFHQFVTGYLAYHAGFPTVVAQAIGLATYGVDLNPATNPTGLSNLLNGGMRADFHAFIPIGGSMPDVNARAQELLGEAILGATRGDWGAVGTYLHFSQDKFVHANLGFGALFGHAIPSKLTPFWWHEPDQPFRDVARAMEAADFTFERLQLFADLSGLAIRPASEFSSLDAELQQMLSIPSTSVVERNDRIRLIAPGVIDSVFPPSIPPIDQSPPISVHPGGTPLDFRIPADQGMVFQPGTPAAIPGPF